eukprot:3942440-Amphidinium_carterae.1
MNVLEGWQPAKGEKWFVWSAASETLRSLHGDEAHLLLIIEDQEGCESQTNRVTHASIPP